MSVFRNLLCITLIATFASGVAMADEKKGKGRKKKGRKGPTATQRFVSKMELTDEQKEKVKAIDKEFAAKLADLNKKRNAILTEEQIAARKEVQAKNRTAGLKGREATKAVNEALNLTDEQKEQQKALVKPQQELNNAILAALKKVLTEEQVAQLPRQGRAAGGKKKKKKKDAA